jgi:hypothetical protein
MVHFLRNDAGYLEWLAKHPAGFVINTYATPSPGYVRLHHASCLSISRLQPGATTFTAGQYSKICGGRAELEEHARRLGGQGCSVVG